MVLPEEKRSSGGGGGGGGGGRGADGSARLRALIRKSERQADALTLADIEECFDFAMDGFQKDAVVAFLKNQNVVVSAPTGR